MSNRNILTYMISHLNEQTKDKQTDNLSLVQCNNIIVESFPSVNTGYITFVEHYCELTQLIFKMLQIINTLLLGLETGTRMCSE